MSTLRSNVRSLIASMLNVEGSLRAGDVFYLNKTVTASTITQAGVDLTGVSTTGAIAIEDVILKTNGTGLAAATNFQIVSNNATGLLLIMAEAVSNLGASKTVQGKLASVTPLVETVLESGKKLTLKATVADATGAGTINITVRCRRMATGATVAVT